ncbi:hypothetical protein GCM10023331_05650 [Algivirga pacifica]|uniref:CUB domain-containing protein n=2 Tax=Algivirga pacifica TaxID=1162670 RepID=A0ABP9D083_9BACT
MKVANAPELLMTDGTTTTCDAIFKDPSGDSLYANEESRIFTIYPSTTGSDVYVKFNFLDLEEEFDYLYVYDATTEDEGALIGAYTGYFETDVLRMRATNVDGALTFKFVSDASVPQEGWEAIVSCVSKDYNFSPDVLEPITDITLFKGFHKAKYTFGQYFNDIDKDVLTYSIATDAGGAAELIVDNDTLKITEVGPGTLTAYLTAIDGNGGQVMDTLTISVIDVNGDVSHPMRQMGRGFAEGTNVYSQTGLAVSMSGNGKRVAVGTQHQSNAGVDYAGMVSIYEWDAGVWTKLGNDLYGETASEWFGSAVALSADGQRLAVAAHGYDSGAGENAGKVTVYAWNGSNWQSLGTSIEGTLAYGEIGSSLALSANGSRMVVGSTRYSAGETGEVNVYDWTGSSWVQVGTPFTGSHAEDQLGNQVSIAADGNTIAMSAVWETNTLDSQGRVSVYTWNGTSWVKKGSDFYGEAAYYNLGRGLALSANGQRIAMSEPWYENAAGEVGRVMSYDWNGSTWGKVGADLVGETNLSLFGFKLALSGDGSTLVVGEPHYSNLEEQVGRVQVYQYNGTAWEQEGVAIPGSTRKEQFGRAVGVSGNGSHMIAGAPYYHANAYESGIARVFQLKAPLDNKAPAVLAPVRKKVIVSGYGPTSLSLSDIFVDPESDALAYTALSQDTEVVSVTVSEEQLLLTEVEIGKTAVDVFVDDGQGNTTAMTFEVVVAEKQDLLWEQLGADIDGEKIGDQFGYAVSVSSDGERIAVGGRLNDGNGDAAGHVRVYQWNGNSWTRIGGDIDGEASQDQFGAALSLSANGNRLIVGAFGNDGNGDATGHARVFEWNGSNWMQLGLDIDGAASGDEFGLAVDISSDGRRVAIGAAQNDFNGIDNAGHVRIYEWNEADWVQLGGDLGGTLSEENFGTAVALSAKGNRLVVGAIGNNNNGSNAGAAYFYEWDGTSWTQFGNTLYGASSGDYFGSSVSFSVDGMITAIGALYKYTSGFSAGQVNVYEWSGANWTQRGSALQGTTGDNFGCSVSLSGNGDRIAVGARGNGGNTQDEGYASVYEWDGIDWVQLDNDILGEASGDNFGKSLSLSMDGSRLVVGAIVNSNYKGHVRAYDLNEIVNNTTPVVINPLTDLYQLKGFAAHLIDLSAVFEDGDGDALSYTVEVLDASVISTTLSGTELTLMEVGEGSTQVTVTATDGNGGVASSSFTIKVEGVIDAPWQTIGGAPASVSNSRYPSLHFAVDGTPYAVHQGPFDTEVFTYQNNAWSLLGNTSFNSCCSGGAIGVDAANNVYMAYQDGDNADFGTVKKFNGSTWEMVGTAAFTPFAVREIKLALSSTGVPYVFYTDTSGGQPNVAYFNGASWVNLGTLPAISGQLLSINITFDANDVPYLYFRQSSRMTVYRYMNNVWSPVGTERFSTHDAQFAHLNFDAANTPYLSYADVPVSSFNQGSFKLTVLKFDGASWVDLVNEAFVHTDLYYTSLVFDAEGSMYVGFRSLYKGKSELIIRRFKDNVWDQVYRPAPDVDYPKLATDTAGNVYVAFADRTNGSRLTALQKPFSSVPPTVVNEIEDVTFEVGQGAYTIDISNVFEDADGDILSYSVVVADESIVTAALSGTNLLLTEVGEGTTTVTLTADDGKGGAVSDAFIVTVNAPANNAPTVILPYEDRTYMAGFTSAGIYLDSAFSDMDGDELTFIASSTNTSVVTTTVSEDWLTLTEVGVGTATITVTANDGKGGVASDDFLVTITGVTNTAPTVVNPIADKSLQEGFTTDLTELSNVFSDTDGDALTYSASVSNTAVVTWSISGSQLYLNEVGVGTATVTVTANDNKGGIISDQFIITVAASSNNLPYVQNTLGNQVRVTGFGAETYDLSNIFADEDGDVLTFGANSSNTSVATTEVTGNTMTLTEVGIGATTITLTADDGKGEQVSYDFLLTVTQSMATEWYGSQTGGQMGRSVSISADARIVAVSSPSFAPTGKVEIFEFNGESWDPKGAAIFGSTSQAQFGISLVLSKDGNRVLIGSHDEVLTQNIYQVYEYQASGWVQIGTDIVGTFDEAFKQNLSISGNGGRIAIGDRLDDTASFHAGKVRVFDYNDTVDDWVLVGQPIYGPSQNFEMGMTVGLSDDGTRLAVGGVDGSNNWSGSAQVYDFNGSNWYQIGGSINGLAFNDWAGKMVISGDGQRIAVGADGFDINDTSDDNAGQVRVFEYDAGNWNIVGDPISGETAMEFSGSLLTLDYHGENLAVSGPGYNDFTGVVRAYRYDGLDWKKAATDFKGIETNDSYGASLQLNGNGRFLVIGAPNVDDVGKWQVIDLKGMFEGGNSGEGLGDIVNVSYTDSRNNSENEIASGYFVLELQRPDLVKSVKLGIMRMGEILSENYTSYTMVFDGGAEYSTQYEISDPFGVFYDFEIELNDGTILYYPEGNYNFRYRQYDAGYFNFAEYIGLGTAESDYRIFSVPLRSEGGMQVQDLLAELGPNDNTKWRMWNWSNGNYREMNTLSSLKPGESYWILSAEGPWLESPVMTTEVRPEIGINQQGNWEPFELLLQPGWNMVSTPFNMPLNWSNILTRNLEEASEEEYETRMLELMDIGGEITTWDGSRGTDQYLQPFGGGFIENSGPTAVSVNIYPIQGYYESVNLRTASEATWKVTMEARGKQQWHTTAYLGMHERATDGFEGLDMHNVPLLMKGLPTANFSRSSFESSNVMGDMISNAEEGKWSFKVNAGSEESLQLRWAKPQLPAGKQLFLFDHISQQLIDMQQVQAYQGTSSTVQFTAFYGSSERIASLMAAEGITMVAAYPNPFREQTTLELMVPEYGAEMQVTIMDVTGKLVKQLYQGQAAEGLLRLNWDGSTSAGRRAQRGMYLYQVKMTDQKGTYWNSGKLVIQ